MISRLRTLRIGDKMANRTRTGFMLLLVFMLLPTIHSANDPCAFFEFPTLSGDTVTIREGSTLTLPFRIRFSTPCLVESFYIEIYHQLPLHGDYMGFCMFRVRNGTCRSGLSSACDCRSGEFSFQFNRTVNRHYNGTWRWLAMHSLVEDKTLYFNIEYEAQVTDLTFHNSTSTNIVDVDTAVDVVCSWENGNPPTQARLLDTHGKIMDSEESSELDGWRFGGWIKRQLLYTLSSVRCEDSGQYRCEAPGATENKTATLLVKCRPEITFSLNEITTVSGATADLKVYVRSHTTNITDCWLKKLFRSAKSRLPLQCDIFSLTGSPPDLVLNVSLDNVQEEDDGFWSLILTNDAGPGQADFLLKVEPAPANEESLWPSSVPVIVPVVSGLAGAVAVVVVVVPVLFLCRRCCRKSAGAEVRQDMASNQSAHLYMEILDEAVRTVEEPPRPCQRRMRHDRPDPAPELFYMSSTIKGVFSSKKRKRKDAAQNVTTASSSKTDTTSSDGYLTPRPLRKRTEDTAGDATAMLPRSDTGLPAGYLTPVLQQKQKKEGNPVNVAMLPMRSETSPQDSSATPLSLRKETEYDDKTTKEIESAFYENAGPSRFHKQ